MTRTPSVLRAQMPEPVPDLDDPPVEEPPDTVPPVEEPPPGADVPEIPIPDRLAAAP